MSIGVKFNQILSTSAKLYFNLGWAWYKGQLTTEKDHTMQCRVRSFLRD